MTTPPCCPLPHLGTRFWWFHLALPLAGFALLATLIEISGWDLAVGDFFHDPAQGGWYGKRLWWANELLHTGGRDLILFSAVSCLAIWIHAGYRPRWRRWRQAAGYLCLVIALTTGTVALGKQLTNQDCPRQLQRYGKTRPYVKLWESKPATLPRGECFPGGHSSGAFALVGVYFVLRSHRRRSARIALGAALLLGTVYGFGQWTRGAHFPSHDLWSALSAWVIALTLYVVFYRSREHSAWNPVPEPD